MSLPPEIEAGFAGAAQGLAIRENLAMALRHMLPEQRMSFAPPPPSYRQDTLLQHVAAASLAVGMIAASGKTHDAEAAAAVFRDVLAQMYPARE